MYHNPVMLKESVDCLIQSVDGTYIDATFGGGGHSKEILNRLSEKGSLWAFDQDKDSLKNAFDDDRFHFVQSNFKYIKHFMKYFDVEEVDGILVDFGVSSHQFDSEDRGFSIRFDAKLDMRMNQQNELTAYKVINTYDNETLIGLFRNYGDLREARKVANAIIKHREEKLVETTSELVQIVTPLFPKNKLNKNIAKVFQSIRIEVNKELECLKEFLLQSVELLKKEGKLVCISYHSLEDRLVKRFIQYGNFDNKAIEDIYGNKKLLFKQEGKLQTPDSVELENNPRSRSAKMRTAIKL